MKNLSVPKSAISLFRHVYLNSVNVKFQLLTAHKPQKAHKPTLFRTYMFLSDLRKNNYPHYRNISLL